MRIALFISILLCAFAVSAQPAPVLHIITLQNRQSLDSAATALLSLREGPARDTLLLRQAIFSRDWPLLENTLSRLASTPYWRTRPGNLGLWRVRSLFFSGALDPLISLLDTMTINPTDPGSAWLLSLRHSAESLDPAGFALRGQIESALYRQNFTEALALYTARPAPERSARHLDYLCGALTAADRPDLVLAAADATVDSTAPERYYYAGWALMEQGRTSPGQAFLEKLLTTSGTSVYAQKARIYLSARKKAP